MTTTTDAPAFLAAKRGMVLVHAEACRDDIIGQPVREYEQVRIGVVTSVTRDGLVKRWTDSHDCTHYGPGEPKHYRGRIYLCPGIGAGAALTVAREHRWPSGHDSMPFGSLAEVRDALRPLTNR